MFHVTLIVILSSSSIFRLYNADSVQAITLDDIENALNGDLLVASNIQQQELLENVAADGHGQQHTPHPNVLCESFPFVNTSSPKDADSDVLPYPVPQRRKKKTEMSSKSNSKFSDEAYQSKLKEKAAKVAREEEKIEKQKKANERKEVRALNKQKADERKASKENAKQTKSQLAKSTKSSQARQRKNEENWKCHICSGHYFDKKHQKYNEDWV